MITNPKEQKICDKYRKRDKEGHVHCPECPLRIGVMHDFRCKATCHYDRRTKEWEYD